MSKDKPKSDGTGQHKLGFLLNIGAKLSGAGFSFLLLILLARNMTPVAFADFSVILAWLAIATTIAGYSTPVVIIRYVAGNLSKALYAQARGVFMFSLALTSTLSLILIILAIVPVVSGWIILPRELIKSVPWIALLLPVGVALTVLSGLLQGLKKVVIAELSINTSRPVLLIIVVAIIWNLQLTPMSTEMVISLYLAISLFILLACFTLVYFSVPKQMLHASSDYRRRLWFRTATGFMAVAVASVINERLDILMMSWLAVPDEIASYAVAARFSQVVTAATIAVSAVMAPHLAEKIHDSDTDNHLEINQLLQHTAKTIVVVTIIALVGFALAGPLILSLFGPHYGNAYIPMIILAGGQVIGAFFGPALPAAMFIGQTRIAVSSLGIGILANLVINLILTPTYGAIGASIAMATGMTVSAMLAHFWLYRKLGIITSCVDYFKKPEQPRTH